MREAVEFPRIYISILRPINGIRKAARKACGLDHDPDNALSRVIGNDLATVLLAFTQAWDEAPSDLLREVLDAAMSAESDVLTDTQMRDVVNACLKQDDDFVARLLHGSADLVPKRDYDVFRNEFRLYVGFYITCRSKSFEIGEAAGQRKKSNKAIQRISDAIRDNDLVQKLALVQKEFEPLRRVARCSCRL